MAVGGYHEIFLGIANPSRALPAGVAGRFQPPQIRGVDGDFIHGLTPKVKKMRLPKSRVTIPVSRGEGKYVSCIPPALVQSHRAIAPGNTTNRETQPRGHHHAARSL